MNAIIKTIIKDLRAEQAELERKAMLADAGWKYEEAIYFNAKSEGIEDAIKLLKLFC